MDFLNIMLKRSYKFLVCISPMVDLNRNKQCPKCCTKCNSPVNQPLYYPPRAKCWPQVSVVPLLSICDQSKARISL